MIYLVNLKLIMTYLIRWWNVSMGNVINFCKLKNFTRKKGQNINMDDTGSLECPYANLFNIKLDKLNSNLATALTAIALVISVLIFSINYGFTSLNNSVKSYQNETIAKFELIQQQLKAQEELNQMQIQRDVAIEFKNQNTNKK